MIYLYLTIAALVGIIGYLWVDNQCMKEKLKELEYENWDLTTELDPVEIYNLREEKE